MSTKLISASLITSACLIFCPVVVTSVAAQTPCGSFTAATGQSGWLLVSGPGIGSPQLPVNVPPHAGWANPIAGSSWVSLNASYGSVATIVPLYYTYEYTFCVCPEKKHALTLTFYADNGAQVFVNSTLIYSTLGISNFTGTASSTSYSGAALVSGTNTLRIVVRNDGAAMGLDALLKVTGARPGCCRSFTSPTPRKRKTG